MASPFMQGVGDEGPGFSRAAHVLASICRHRIERQYDIPSAQNPNTWMTGRVHMLVFREVAGRLSAMSRERAVTGEV
jgi:hypothetical protein